MAGLTEGQGNLPAPSAAEVKEFALAGEWLARGVACLENSAPAEAAACFQNCLALDPCHIDGLWQAARLEATLERRLAALALIERLLAVAPDFREAQVVAARLDAALDWYDRAHARFAGLGPLTGWWEQTRLERVAAVRRTREMLATAAGIGRVTNPAELAKIARGRLSLGHLPACEAALRRLETLRPGSMAAVAIRVQLVLRQHGLAAALAFMRALPHVSRAALIIPYARLLHEAGDYAGVRAALGNAAEEPGALALLTISNFASGDQQDFFAASSVGMERSGGETRPCMFVIAAARQQDLVVRLGEAPAIGQAPRMQLLQYWHTRDIPPDLEACLASWRLHNPSLDQRILCRDEARAIIVNEGNPELLLCFDEAPHPAVQSDIIRLVVLARDGGIYADADERCVAPLTPLLQRLGAVEFAGWLSPDMPAYLFNGFLAVRKGSRIIRSALEEMVLLRRDHRARGIKSDVWQVSGPGLITRAVARALSAPGGAGTIMLLIDREWRRFAHTDEALAYKQTGAGNWRIG